MSSITPHYTSYPYVNEAVHVLLENVKGVLGNYFLGLYLHGSLAGGYFNPDHSDIDFLIVTTQELPEKIIPKLKKMHKHIWENGSEWVRKLEGTYIPVNSLYKYNASDPPRPHVNADKFMFIPNEQYWVIERQILREKGVVIAGPPIRSLIAPITSKEIRQSVILGISEAWPSRVNDGEWLTLSGYQPYIVLTCCRILYTLKYGTIKSKQVSARWALKALGHQWQSLIKEAMKWKHRIPNGDINHTLEMMKYTLARIEAYRAKLPGNL
jgi:predicted nucleotidyltransferase